VKTRFDFASRPIQTRSPCLNMSLGHTVKKFFWNKLRPSSLFEVGVYSERFSSQAKHYPCSKLKSYLALYRSCYFFTLTSWRVKKLGGKTTASIYICEDLFSTLQPWKGARLGVDLFLRSVLIGSQNFCKMISLKGAKIVTCVCTGVCRSLETNYHVRAPEAGRW
jgi:hypothetical protein